MAAQNPKTIAATTQRNGHGNALRTAMRGALMVNRRRRRRKRMFQNDPWSMLPQKQKPPQANLTRLCDNT
jgi:hypothetical protein